MLSRGALAVPALVLLGGCEARFSTLEPSGPVASSIALLWWGMLAGSIVLMALMVGLFIWVMMRPDQAKRIPVKRWIIWGGLVLPAIVLPPLVTWALIAGERILPHPGTAVSVVEVEAFQFGWRFRYPDHGGVETVDVMHLPVGVPVDVHITTTDVIHSFWIPQLAGKLDAVPGHTHILRIQADEVGTYGGLCSEFCGLEHAAMRFIAYVHEPEDLDAALAGAPDTADTSEQDTLE